MKTDKFDSSNFDHVSNQPYAPPSKKTESKTNSAEEIANDALKNQEEPGSAQRLPLASRVIHLLHPPSMTHIRNKIEKAIIRVGNAINHITSSWGNQAGSKPTTEPPNTPPPEPIPQPIDPPETVESKPPEIPMKWSPRISQDVINAADLMENRNIFLGNQRFRSNTTLFPGLGLFSKGAGELLLKNPNCLSHIREFIVERRKVNDLAKIVAPEGDLLARLQWHLDHLETTSNTNDSKLNELLYAEMNLWWCSICALKAYHLNNRENLNAITKEISEYNDLLDEVVMFPVGHPESLRLQLEFVIAMLDPSKR